MLLPFRNVTRVTAQDWLVTGAPLMLGESLGQFQDLTVVSEEKLNAARRRLSIRADSQPDATQLRRLAEETDGWTAVTGNVYATGQKLRISLTATDVQTTRVVTTASTEIAMDADVRQAFDTLTVRLVTPTGVRGARTDLAALTTQSTDAYRAYARGVEFMQHSAFRRAQAAFTKAVTLDSMFALGWLRLAYSTANANVLSLLDPANPALRAVERSVRFGQRLPPRQLEYLRAMQNYLRGQMARARHSLDSLAATDADDLDARELLSGLEVADFELDTAAGPPRMATSMNRAMARAREVLDRDPGRRNVYYTLAMGYALGGGWFMGARPGMRGTFGSFLAMMMKLAGLGPDATFVPVLGDSIELMPLAEFMKRPPAERARLRRRSADAGMEWVERWLAAGPQDAEPHLWASRFAELRDDASRALRELTIADSLGVESAWENVAQRRLELLFRAERYSAAAALADSLLKTGKLAQRSLAPGLDRGRGYGMAAFLLQKRWVDAGAAATVIPARDRSRPACEVALDEFATTTGESGGAALRAMTDSVARHVTEVAAVPTLAPCLDSLVLLVNDSTAGRRTFAGAALLAVADSLQRAGNDAFALRAARWAWEMDTLRRAEISKRPWFRAADTTAVPARPDATQANYFDDSAGAAHRNPVRERSSADPLAFANMRYHGVATASGVLKAPPRIT
jgi:TolB-like protein